MTLYKPRMRARIDCLGWDAKINHTWQPQVISAKWSKNHHRAADELILTVPWTEGGIDPRMVKHCRVHWWLWDDEHDTFDQARHLRFAGIGKYAERKIDDGGNHVEFMFQDYTALFLAMKPFPSDGIPEWSDTLKQAWAKIRQYTGSRDIDTGEIKSNCENLSTIIFDPPALGNRTLGEMVTSRFHAISKPTPPARTDAWRTWLWICDCLGLTTWIDKDECFVSDTNEFYTEENAVRFIYGHNIKDFSEKADTYISSKGILGKSFNYETGELLESAFPPPGDDFIKKTRGVAKRALKQGREVNLNETSGEYEEYAFHGVNTQEALDKVVRAAFEEFGRQEIKGTIKTAEMLVPNRNGSMTDILGLKAGDCIEIGVDERARDIAVGTASFEERVKQLMEECGYPQGLAELVVRTISDKAFVDLIFHLETLEVEVEVGKFDLSINYHNKVYLDSLDA